MAISFTSDQQTQLQSEVQAELERREWAEPDDNVMAEYITVLLANGNSREKVHTEMNDLVGSDFDERFLEWLFDTAADITRTPGSRPSPSPVPDRQRREPASANGVTGERRAAGDPSHERRNRLLDSALGDLHQGEKRKSGADGRDDRDGAGAGNKRRISDHGAPSGPRSMGGRNLADRIGGRGPPGGGGQRGMPIRGMGRGGMNGNGMGMSGNMPMAPMGGFQPGMMQPGPNAGFGFFPMQGQNEMMAQMMMMQANMQQMGEMMAKMAEERAVGPQASVRPPRPPAPAKIPPGTKLGAHSVSIVPPKRSSSPGPIPDKPSSAALCKFGVGCSNSRCHFSHPSPVADEKTGMVLSEEACEAGKNCKDPECTMSHVSPAAILGNSAGPSRMLCKYQNCTNPSCAFRHEDAEGNPVPPPALTAMKSTKGRPTKVEPAKTTGATSDGEDGEGDAEDVEVVVSSKNLMDGALDDTKAEKVCRYGERCTRADCFFKHPPSRPSPRGAKGYRPPGRLAPGGMNMSKKFGAKPSGKLDPSAGEFKPTEVAS
ncbi:hypothetical protein BD324DRAFT_626414 [Kockovaella imperatae]|uniref:C3H1-type domain-containing protein n=1 Tax=Kockovaella imperatae TaxID=4999 RepID=A0A1Y1UEU0_9TREE|nr:hypothetical protein BD324DRAFT_626414 [Kockovaella imperatae]ORX36581.1 hypothetical protein BD324DRAFT_626414 [Kockovaella imperatae]